MHFTWHFAGLVLKSCGMFLENTTPSMGSTCALPPGLPYGLQCTLALIFGFFGEGS